MRKLIFTLASIGLGLASVWGADEIDRNSWMETLPDNAMVRQLSLPGSHDAATSSLNGGSTGGKTQTYTIAEQFERGVRVFDLRPREDMYIYHTSNTRVTMDDVFTSLGEKLEENPSEFAIFVIRFERDNPTEAQTSEWESKMKEITEKYADLIVPFSPGITVNEVRGKIIVLSRNNFDSEQVAIINNWSHWENLDDQLRNYATIKIGRVTTKLYIQDKFEYEDVEIKKSAVLGLLNWASDNNDDQAWVINHASGYKPGSILGISIGATTQFETNAENINSYFIDNLPERRTGIVLMDFAGDNSDFSHLFSDKGSYHGKDLVDAIIAHNATYLPQEPEEDDDFLTGVQTVAGEGEREIFTISGVKVTEANGLFPGLYIVRQGGKINKIMIK